jgi:hypothetical protein
MHSFADTVILASIIAVAAVWLGWFAVQSYQLKTLQQSSIASVEQLQHDTDNEGNQPYVFSSYIASCFADKYAILMQHSLQRAHFSLVNHDSEAHALALNDAQAVAVKRLQCEAMHAKAWLDYALLLVQSEGMSTRSIQALLQSAMLSPNEVWLAEWRLPWLLHALTYDVDEKQQAMLVQAAQHDRSALLLSYGWRQKRFDKAYQQATEGER